MENINKAIMAFSQSEKVKAGIIWASQAVNLLQGCSETEKRGGEKVINVLINMISQEVKLAVSLSGDNRWEGIGPHFEKAVAMIDSGVSEEATVHLSKALSMVTNIGQQSMLFLKEKDLL